MDFSELNEADVREECIAPMLRALGYQAGSENGVRRELELRYPCSFLGRKSPQRDPPLRGRADYVLDAGGRVRWVVEAKPPSSEICSDEIEQAYSYAKHPEVRGVYFALCNGHRFVVYRTDQSPECSPVLELDYPAYIVPDEASPVFGLLSPAAVLRDFPNTEVLDGPPIGLGLRSLARIVGGTVSYHRAPAPIGELQISISGGSIQRSDDGTLLASYTANGLIRSIDEYLRRNGLSEVVLTSNDEALSSDPEKPTVFRLDRSLVFSAGDSLVNLTNWQPVVFQSDVNVRTSVLATGVLAAKVFRGEIENQIEMGELGSLTLLGRFEFFLA